MKIGEFTLVGQDGNARAGVLQTKHGAIETPVFMPVGTKASVKSLDPAKVEELGAQIVLGNTYHLYLAPGDERICDLGGLHQFMQWNKPILTDSGGFQVFSLGAGKNRDQRSDIRDPGEGNQAEFVPEARVTEDGVEFRSHKDGSSHFFTPEKAIEIQANLGADIIMAFDECAPYPSTDEYYRASMERTHRWLDRCIEHKKTLERTHLTPTLSYQERVAGGRVRSIQSTPPQDQLLFGIVQGGMNKQLREESAQFVSSKGLSGVAIGGVAVGETRETQREQVEWVMPHLPKDVPHYLMGIGAPLDLVEFVARGVDMFDCVLPTRLARNGAAWVVERETHRVGRGERIQIKNARFANDPTVLDSSCTCSTCARFSRAYIHHLFMENEPLGMQLLSIHNLHVLIEEMRQIREHILAGTFSHYHKTLRALWVS